MRRWIRLYTELLNDPKVQRLPAEIFRVYINLLCVAGQDDNGGAIPEDIGTLAFVLRLPDSDCKAAIDTLIDHGLVDKNNEGIAIHGWEKRQYESDTDPTRYERVKRFREKKETDEAAQDDEKVKRVSHAFRNGNETRIDTDTDTETEYINISSPNGDVAADAPIADPSPYIEAAKRRKSTCRSTKQPTSQSTSLTVLEPERELYQKTIKSFEAVFGQFSNYGREGSAIKKIIKLANGDEQTVRLMLEVYLKLTKSRDKFWSSQPFTPSALLSLWDRVRVEAEKTVNDMAGWEAVIGGGT